LSDLPQPVRRPTRAIDAELYRKRLCGGPAVGALAGILAALFAASALQHRGAPASVWILGRRLRRAGPCPRLVLLTQTARRTGSLGQPARRRAAFAAGWLNPAHVYPAPGLGARTAVVHREGTSPTGGLLTGIWLAAAGLSAPLVAAARPAIYLWLAAGGGARSCSRWPCTGRAKALVLAVVGSVFLLVLMRLVLEQNESLAAGAGRRGFRTRNLVEQLRNPGRSGPARAQPGKDALSWPRRFHDLRQPPACFGPVLRPRWNQRLHDIPERPLIKNMMASIEALETSFGAMLDISRLDAGVVRACAAVVSGARTCSGRLYQQFGGDAPNRTTFRCGFRAARRLVLSDPQLLERVPRQPAAKRRLRYTRQGGVLGWRPGGTRAAWPLEVWDTGVGIPAEKLELIFEEFYIFRSTTRNATAAGVWAWGWPSCGGLCNLLGHPLEVRSHAGARQRCSASSFLWGGRAGPDPNPRLEADTFAATHRCAP